jgi:hypothetical protein
VGELAALLALRDSTVSQHLSLLRRDGLVAARRDGQMIWYSIGSAPARDLVRTLYNIYCTPKTVRGPKPRGRSVPALRRSQVACVEERGRSGAQVEKTRPKS